MRLDQTLLPFAILAVALGLSSGCPSVTPDNDSTRFSHNCPGCKPGPEKRRKSWTRYENGLRRLSYFAVRRFH